MCRWITTADDEKPAPPNTHTPPNNPAPLRRVPLERQLKQHALAGHRQLLIRSVIRRELRGPWRRTSGHRHIILHPTMSIALPEPVELDLPANVWQLRRVRRRHVDVQHDVHVGLRPVRFELVEVGVDLDHRPERTGVVDVQVGCVFRVAVAVDDELAEGGALVERGDGAEDVADGFCVRFFGGVEHEVGVYCSTHCVQIDGAGEELGGSLRWKIEEGIELDFWTRGRIWMDGLMDGLLDITIRGLWSRLNSDSWATSRNTLSTPSGREGHTFNALRAREILFFFPAASTHSRHPWIDDYSS